MSVFFLVLVAIPILFLALLWKYSYWHRRGVPQGNPLKLFAGWNDIMFTSAPHWHLYLSLGRKFAGKPFYGLYTMGRPQLFLNDPEMVKEVMLRKYSSMCDNGFQVDQKIEPIISRDPCFTEGGDRWKENSTNFSSLMTPARLRNMSLELIESSKETVKYLTQLNHESGKGDGTDVKNLSQRFMTDVLVRVTLGVDAECFKPEESAFYEMGQKVFHSGWRTFFVMICMIIYPKVGPLLGLSLIPDSVTNFFRKVIKDQKEFRLQNGITRSDILGLMMKKANKNENDADHDVLATITLFIVEALETTSTGIAVCLVELARDQELQERLRQQILLASPLGKEITEEAINSNDLLHNCFLESLRIYPPGFLLQRVVTKDVTLRAETGEEVFLKTGSHINIPMGAIQRRPDYYENPDVFDPNRFNDLNQKQHLISFGVGPRHCPGERFAMMAGKISLAMILREFKLELSPKTKYPLESQNNPLLFALKDVYVRFVRL